MDRYPQIWNGPRGQVPARIIEQISEGWVTIRTPDPYDSGEVQFAVPVNEIEPS